MHRKRILRIKKFNGNTYRLNNGWMYIDSKYVKGNRFSDFEIGGKRGGLPYKPPLKGWNGFCLNVMDKYDNQNNDWLGCNGNPNEWAVVYHEIGTRGGLKVKKMQIM